MKRRDLVLTYGVPPNIYLTEALTPREVEVLAGMARGDGYKELARHLGISWRTTRTHASKVLVKLGARNRTDAVRIGYQLGYLPPHEPQTAREAIALAGYYANLANDLLQREERK